MIIRPYSITGGEIEQFYSTKKLKIQVEGNATVEVIGKVKKALEKATDVKQFKQWSIVYAHPQLSYCETMIANAYAYSCGMQRCNCYVHVMLGIEPTQYSIGLNSAALAEPGSCRLTFLQKLVHCSCMLFISYTLHYLYSCAHTPHMQLKPPPNIFQQIPESYIICAGSLQPHLQS